MGKEIFLEIGTEEIPAGFLPKAMADLERMIRKEGEMQIWSINSTQAASSVRGVESSESAKLSGQQAIGDGGSVGHGRRAERPRVSAVSKRAWVSE